MADETTQPRLPHSFLKRGQLAAFPFRHPFAVAECLGLISLLSIVPVWAGLRLFGKGAVAAPGFAGAVAGFVAGSGVAAGYSLFCTRDNPLFYLVWYSVAIGIATAAGALLGRRMLRW